MAKANLFFWNGNGKPLSVTLDVTPSWWKRQKPNAYGAVAALLQRGFFLTELTLGFEHVLIKTPLVREEPLEPRVTELLLALEEMGSEWARPKDEP